MKGHQTPRAIRVQQVGPIAVLTPAPDPGGADSLGATRFYLSHGSGQRRA